MVSALPSLTGCNGLLSASQKLEVIPYNTTLHAQGVKNILNQTTPTGMSYNSLVGDSTYIVDVALQDGYHNGHVLYDSKKKEVAGFVACSQSHNRRDSNDSTSQWWYVDWLALHMDYQGNRSISTPSSVSTKKSNAILLWDQVVKDATAAQLPIMLNTLRTNKRMQDWCTRRGLFDEGSPLRSALKYYSYQEHLPKARRILRAENMQNPDGTTDREAMKRSDQSIPAWYRKNFMGTDSGTPGNPSKTWLYRHRYKLILGAGVAACILIAGYKYRVGLPKPTF